MLPHVWLLALPPRLLSQLKGSQNYVTSCQLLSQLCQCRKQLRGAAQAKRGPGLEQEAPPPHASGPHGTRARHRSHTTAHATTATELTGLQITEHTGQENYNRADTKTAAKGDKTAQEPTRASPLSQNRNLNVRL